MDIRRLTLRDLTAHESIGRFADLDEARISADALVPKGHRFLIIELPTVGNVGAGAVRADGISNGPSVDR